ncbi:MAG: TRAP transporter substrate-binding protein DctP [Dehalococcoidales bacterium]|nr:TRAP transporter substrate-binding protein DctP [Dehalococcoidales bacterium]
MKKIFISGLIMILLCAFILSGCSASTSSSPSSSQSSSSPVAPATTAAPADSKVIELKLSSWVPPKSLIGEMIDAWIERVHERAGDQVHITHYASSTMGAVEDHNNMVINRVADIVQPGGGFNEKLDNVLALPFLFENAKQTGYVQWKMIEKFHGDYELKAAKPLFLMPVSAYNLICNRHEVRELADLKGLKIATISSGIDPLKVMGGSPVSISPTESYTAIERNLVDGMLCNWEQAFIFKEYEVTKYRTGNINIFGAPNQIVINWDAWNELPPDVQQVFEETGGLAYSLENGEIFDQTDIKFRDMIAEYDVKVGNPPRYDISNEERARWKEACMPIYDDWVKDATESGLPGQEILDFVNATIEEFNANNK